MPASKNKFENSFLQILLIGDFASHEMLIRARSKAASNTTSPTYGQQDEPLYESHCRGPEKPLLPEMIRNALSEGRTNGLREDVIFPDYRPGKEKSADDRPVSESSTVPHNPCGRHISVLDLFPRYSHTKGGKKILRMKEEYSSTASRGDGSARKYLVGICSDWEHKQKNGSANTHRQLLVIYDQNGFIRDAIGSCLSGQGKSQLQSLVASARDGIIIGINGDPLDETWLNTLQTLIKSKDPKSKVIVQVAVDTLRKAGLNITKYGALEDTIQDIFDSEQNRLFRKLVSIADSLVILFRETGGLHIKNCRSANPTATLHFCPNFDKIAQADVTEYGGVPGKFAIYLTSLVKAAYVAAESDDPEANIDGALRLGTVAYNWLFSHGLGSSSSDVSPFDAIVNALASKQCEEMALRTTDAAEREFLVSSLSLEKNQFPGWSRTSEFFSLGDEDFSAKLRMIVEKGLDKTLSVRGADVVNPFLIASEMPKKPWFPSRYITVPYASFKALKLLEKKEIADHYSLANLIRKYLETETWSTPLSIAVFGKPGSGKSFGVQQVLASVDPGRTSQPLTFNLAQFSSVDQLTDAFHQIQDRALSSHEVPLAIFDEFDANFENRFGWLKYFLAPMQDGQFRGKGGDYKVGRAIFLFSGGTEYSFDDFASLATAEVRHGGKQAGNGQARPPARKADAEVERAQNELRAAKIGDFISRLRGHLDVADINSGAGEHGNKMQKLRRAMILRSLLEKHAQPIFVSSSDGVEFARIHPSVVDAFLSQPYFRYGVRSMEAIIQMSRWIDGRFVPSSLPIRDQLKIHTLDGQFLAWVEENNKKTKSPATKGSSAGARKLASAPGRTAVSKLPPSIQKSGTRTNIAAPSKSAPAGRAIGSRKATRTHGVSDRRSRTPK